MILSATTLPKELISFSFPPPGMSIASVTSSATTTVGSSGAPRPPAPRRPRCPRAGPRPPRAAPRAHPPPRRAARPPPAQAALLLACRRGVHGSLVVTQSPQRLVHDEDADAVVHRLADIVGPDLLQRAVHDRVVPDADLLLHLVRRHAEVHEELVHLGHLVGPAAPDARPLAPPLAHASP